MSYRSVAVVRGSWQAAQLGDMGYFDDETCRLEPIDNLFGPKVLPCLRNEVLPMVRNGPEKIGRDHWIRITDPYPAV
jgi:hypothetical protein